MVKWIDVKSKLPKSGKKVLLLVDGEMIQGYYNDENYPWYYTTLSAHGCGCCADSSEDTVTHWSELPELPPV